MLVGLIARYHRKGEPDASELGGLARDGDAERLRLLCGIIRLAEQLERSRDGAIRRVSVAARNGTVTLAADADPERDPTVPIWAARQNADLLAAGTRSRGRDRVTPIAAGVVLAVVLFDVTALSVLMPSIRLDLGSSSSGGQWVLTAYLLALAALLPVLARLALPRRALIAAGALAMAAGGVVAASADSTAAVVVGQAVAGTGAAAVLASMEIPDRVAPAALALPLLALALGPAIGGALAEHNWWRLFFWARRAARRGRGRGGCHRRAGGTAWTPGGARPIARLWRGARGPGRPARAERALGLWPEPDRAADPACRAPRGRPSARRRARSSGRAAAAVLAALCFLGPQYFELAHQLAPSAQRRAGVGAHRTGGRGRRARLVAAARCCLGGRSAWPARSWRAPA